MPDYATNARPATVFGIDSHLRTTTVCALVVATGETETRAFRGNDYGEIAEWMARGGLPKPARGFYEAGCTGFVPARLLTAGDVEVVPVAPSKVPTSQGSRRRKNDREDAARIARLAAAGELREVWVPTEEVEGLRDLHHALRDLTEARTAARQRVLSLLGRHGLVWEGRTPKGRPAKAWGARFRAWLRAVELPSEGARAALAAAVRAEESATEQREALLARAREVVAASSLAGTAEALTCLRCVGFVASLAFCAEVGDFSRFGSGRAITSYVGLAPSESSSGERTRNGAITRCGSGSLRAALTECAWSAARGRPSSAKACPESVDPRVRERARTLSARLCERRRAMLERGVHPCKANSATAAELARSMLFLGRAQQAIEAEGAS